MISRYNIVDVFKGNKLFKIIFVIIFLVCSKLVYAGPFSDFKAGAGLSEELASSPTERRNKPNSDSIVQSREYLDPKNSEVWNDLQNELLGENANVFFVDDIKLIMQDYIEEAHKVPLIVALPKRLQNFNKFILLIENNPIQQVISLKPYRAIEALGMNVRLEDDSPIRAAVLDNEGNWHVGSKMVFVASAGGCSTPACDPAIEVCKVGIVGKIAVKEYKREAGAQRIKLKITHPMETGFVVDLEGEVIPEYFIKKIHVDDKDGPIADITTYAALSSDPVILLDLPEKGQSVRVRVMDSHGLEFFSYKKDNSM